MKKIKLLCCIHDFRGRGAEKVLSILLKEFNREIFQIGVFVAFNNFCYSLPKDIAFYSTNLKRSNEKLSLWYKTSNFVQKIFSLIKTCRHFSPDIIFSVTGTNEIVAIVSRFFFRNTKIVLCEHSVLSKLLSETSYGFIQKFRSKLICYCYSKADMIVAPSSIGLEDLHKNFKIDNKNMKMIFNPINRSEILKLAKSSDSEAGNHEEHYFKIGFIGSLSQEKNVECLIKAFERKSCNLKWRLEIVGDGQNRPKLEAMADHLLNRKEILFHGHQNNPYSFLIQWDVTVLPSFRESFPCVLLESMVCEVPVITSEWDGSENIYKNRSNCLTFPVNDDKKLFESLCEIHENVDLRDSLKNNASKWVLQFDAKIIVKEYENIFMQCLNREKY
jgi:glycosyltransferase involved in cell wall biosynthesis